MSFVSIGKLEDDILENMQVREPVSFPDSHSQTPIPSDFILQ